MRTVGLLELPSYGFDVRRSALHFAGRRLAGMSLLEWVVRRITDCTNLDDVAVIAPAEPYIEPLARLTPNDVRVLMPAGNDCLQRFVRAAHDCAATAVVRFRVDHPLVDSILTDRLIATAQSRSGLDYASFSSRWAPRSVRQRVLAFGEWCRIEALEDADRLAVTELERRDVTRFLWSHPRLYQLGWTPLPEELDREDVRLVIDGEEDWEHVNDIVEALGGENLDWRTVAELLAHQPVMRDRMQHLNRAAEAAAAVVR